MITTEELKTITDKDLLNKVKKWIKTEAKKEEYELLRNFNYDIVTIGKELELAKRLGVPRFELSRLFDEAAKIYFNRAKDNGSITVFDD